IDAISRLRPDEERTVARESNIAMRRRFIAGLAVDQPVALDDGSAAPHFAMAFALDFLLADAGHLVRGNEGWLAVVVTRAFWLGQARHEATGVDCGQGWRRLAGLVLLRREGRQRGCGLGK